MKKEKNEELIKKGFKKAGFALTMASAACALLAGCAMLIPEEPNNSNQNSTNSSSSSEIVEDSSGILDSSSSDSSIEEVPEDNIPYDKIQNVLDKLEDRNFEFAHYVGFETYIFDVDDNIFFTHNAADQRGDYYYSENDKCYKLIYDKTSRIWNKYIDESKKSVENIFYDNAIAVDWTDYDEDTNELTGQINGKNIVYNIETGQLDGDIRGKLRKFGEINLTLPSEDKIVDMTGEKDPVDEVDNSAKLYTVSNGVYTFDIPLMQEALLDWAKGKNLYNKDILKEIWSGSVVTTNEIPFVKADKDNIEFGIVYTKDGQKIFGTLKLLEESFYEKIQNGQIQTKNQFISYLNELDKKRFDFTTNHVVIDTEISPSNFNSMTKNIFYRLQTKGTQGSSINNNFPETKIADFFDDADVLYGFKTKAGTESAAFDMGFVKGWSHYYIVRFKGKIELVKAVVVSCTANGVSNENENVIKNNEYNWMVGSVSREEINYANILLHEDALATAKIATGTKSKRQDVILDTKKSG